MFRTKSVEEIKLHFLFYIFFEYIAVEEINKVKQSRYRPGVAQRVPGS
jgi:hypothetical protein